MGIFDGLEKLITEHGSAAILKERIALANDKYAALERKVVELTEENRRLRAENAELRAKEPAQVVGIAQEVDEVALNVLQLLSKHSDLQIGHIAHNLGIDREIAAFHVEELENANFINGSYSMMSEPTYSLGQEGRRFLIKNGHLK